MNLTSSTQSEQSKLQGYPTAATDQEPSETGMLVLIARCLLEANLPSLSKHCLRAAELILEQQRVIAIWEGTEKKKQETIQKLLEVKESNDKAIDRLWEHKWKDIEIAKAEEEDYKRNLMSKPKVLQKVNPKQTDWVVELSIEQKGKPSSSGLASKSGQLLMYFRIS